MVTGRKNSEKFYFNFKMKKFIFFHFLSGAVTMVTMAQSSHSNENVFILLPRLAHIYLKNSQK